MTRTTIQDYRAQIDELDQQLLKLFAKRFDVVGSIMAMKKTQDLPLRDDSRFQSMLKHRLTQAQTLHLNDTFIQQLFNLIHHESLQQ